jgi:hypothetical protein
MRVIRLARWQVFGLGTAVALALAAPASGSAASVRPSESVRYKVGPISHVSVGCPGGTGDISEAVDRARHYVYQEFEGCEHSNGIGFARSTNGGHSYTRPVPLPHSYGGWDPWLAVAPDGTLYAAFMKTADHRTYPFIEVSHDYGRTFDVEQSLRPAKSHNWGDADYLAVSASGALYVAWGYGPSNAEVKSRCSPTGSCWADAGDLNVVVQRSTDEGRTFTPISVVNPGYPNGGADEGQVAVAPDGAVDVLYQGYEVVNRKTLKLANGHEYFTTSADGGKRWSAPVEVGASAGKMTINEWWNDGSIATDSAGNLYATWDTQGKAGNRRTDIGWVSFSTDGGKTWSAPIRVTPGERYVPHITQVAGAGPGRAYVGWLTDSDPRGYALYLRTFSIGGNGGGWLSGPVRISRKFGNPNDGPCDTFGIEILSPAALALSWGSAIPGSHGNPSVFAAPVTVLTR